MLTGEDHGATMDYLRDLERGGGIERAAPLGVGQGSIGYGAGGPVWLDDFQSERPPTPSELVNAYKSVAFACISLNANAVARVPLRLYCKTGPREARPRFWPTRSLGSNERDQLNKRLYRNRVTRGMASGDDHVDEVMQHPLLDVLDAPNPYFDGNALIQYLARTLDAVGTAYWYPDRLAGDWAPSEIWPLHSQYCYPVKGTGRTLIQNYTYFSETFAPEDLVRFRFVSLRDPYLSGYAPLHACFEQLKLVGYYNGVVKGMLKGGARPEGMIGPKDSNQPWTEPQRKRIDADVNSRFGNGRQGRIWTVDGSFEFTQLTYPPADLATLAVSKDARLIAANCFDVPISMLEAEDSNKATASEGATQHQRNAVDPRCAIIGGALTHQVARKVDPRLFYAFDDPVQKDRATDAKIHKVYIDTKVLTPNEVRADLGREPREGGDEVASDPVKPEAGTKPGAGQEEDEEKDE